MIDQAVKQTEQDVRCRELFQFNYDKALDFIGKASHPNWVGHIELHFFRGKLGSVKIKQDYVINGSIKIKQDYVIK